MSEVSQLEELTNRREVQKERAGGTKRGKHAEETDRMRIIEYLKNTGRTEDVSDTLLFDVARCIELLEGGEKNEYKDVVLSLLAENDILRDKIRELELELEMLENTMNL